MERQVVVFKLAEEEYGASILAIKEIVRYQPINRLPNTPYFIEGIINLRNKIYPVIDLRKRFKEGSSKINEHTRIIITELVKASFGLVVDAVAEVLRVEEAKIEEPPEILVDANTVFIEGIAKVDSRNIILLNLERLFSREEKELLSTVA